MAAQSSWSLHHQLQRQHCTALCELSSIPSHRSILSFLQSKSESKAFLEKKKSHSSSLTALTLFFPLQVHCLTKINKAVTAPRHKALRKTAVIKTTPILLLLMIIIIKLPANPTPQSIADLFPRQLPSNLFLCCMECFEILIRK